MARLIVASLLLHLLLSEVYSIQVTIPRSTVSTGLFTSVTLQCDYSTSASLQNVLVVWTYKSFCLDPVLNYFSTDYQAAMQLGHDPADDCADSKRVIRTVAQKYGASEATLGPEYTQRKITIQNRADLVIGEVMWWDNGMYVCTVNAAGDTTGYPYGQVKLIVYGWLTVLFMVIGALLLILLLAICCCQCCPQHCCCYVRCPCCPQTCCCPEKAVMQHRMIKQAQKAMNPWTNGQMVYAPLSSHGSAYQMNPMLYAGSASGKIPLTPIPPMPLPPPSHMEQIPLGMPVPMHGPIPVAMPPPNMHVNGGPNKVLDYLESQMREMDVTNPLIPPPPVHMTHKVPFSAGPPSMLSGLGDGPASRRHPAHSSHSSSNDRHHQRPPYRGMNRSYSQDDVLENHSRVGYRPRSRSRDDLMDDPRDSWESASVQSSRRGGGYRDEARGVGWPNNPPSYREFEPGQKPPKRNARMSVRSSRSGKSVVI